MCVEDGVLKVCGEQRGQRVEEGKDYRRFFAHHRSFPSLFAVAHTFAALPFLSQERWYGSASRQLLLPDSVDPNQISACHSNGVLSLTLKKKPECIGMKVLSSFHFVRPHPSASKAPLISCATLNPGDQRREEDDCHQQGLRPQRSEGSTHVHHVIPAAIVNR